MKRMYDENEIKSIASESGGGKLYFHDITIMDTVPGSSHRLKIIILSSKAEKFTINDIANSQATIIPKNFIDYSNHIAYEVNTIMFDTSVPDQPGSVSVYYFDKYPYATNSTTYYELNSYKITDYVYEL